MKKIVSTKNNLRLRIRNNENGASVFKAIISHPMETGNRRNLKTGDRHPADYIKDLVISVDGEKYFEVTLGADVSRNPYLSFTFSKPLVSDQEMTISWVDNNQNKTSYNCVVKIKPNGLFSFNGEKEGSEIFQFSPVTGPICNTNVPKKTP